MRKTNIGRLLLIYCGSGLLISLISFLALMISIYVPAVRELSPEASTPGSGLFVFFLAEVSVLIGVTGGFPATWLISRRTSDST